MSTTLIAIVALVASTGAFGFLWIRSMKANGRLQERLTNMARLAAQKDQQLQKIVDRSSYSEDEIIKELEDGSF